MFFKYIYIPLTKISIQTKVMSICLLYSNIFISKSINHALVAFSFSFLVIFRQRLLYDNGWGETPVLLCDPERKKRVKKMNGWRDGSR